MRACLDARNLFILLEAQEINRVLIPHSHQIVGTPMEEMVFIFRVDSVCIQEQESLVRTFIFVFLSNLFFLNHSSRFFVSSSFNISHLSKHVLASHNLRLFSKLKHGNTVQVVIVISISIIGVSLLLLLRLGMLTLSKVHNYIKLGQIILGFKDDCFLCILEHIPLLVLRSFILETNLVVSTSVWN